MVVASGNGDWAARLPRAILVIVGFLLFLVMRHSLGERQRAQGQRDDAAARRFTNSSDEPFLLLLRSFEVRPPDVVPPELGGLGVSYGKNTDTDEIFSWIERS